VPRPLAFMPPLPARAVPATNDPNPFDDPPPRASNAPDTPATKDAR
jgi:hypothetical protein